MQHITKEREGSKGVSQCACNTTLVEAVCVENVCDAVPRVMHKGSWALIEVGEEGGHSAEVWRGKGITLRDDGSGIVFGCNAREGVERAGSVNCHESVVLVHPNVSHDVVGEVQVGTRGMRGGGFSKGEGDSGEHLLDTRANSHRELFVVVEG